MKRIVSIIMVLSLIIALTSCSGRSSEKKNSSDEESSESQVVVDESLLTVDVNIPASFFDEEDPATAELTEEQKADGYKSAKVNDDGSVTYTIKKSSWKKILADYKEELIKSLNDIAASDDYPSIKKVTFNDDFTKIVLDVDKDQYENSFDSFANLTIYISVAYYQIFSQKEAACSIAARDISSGKTFSVANYPDDFNDSAENE